MKVVYPITNEFVEALKEWEHDPETREYLLGNESLETFVRDITSGKVIAVGLEQEGWKGIATLDIKADQAELAMFAPGKSRQASLVIFKLAEYLSLSKIHIKMRAERFRGWQKYGKEQWERIGNTWGWQYAGMLGDPLQDEQKWFILGVRSIKNEFRR